MSDEETLPNSLPLDIRVLPAEEIRGPPDTYKNETNPRGTVFIANYRTFKSLGTREGSELDVQNFRELFQQIGYTNIDGIVDATREDTLDTIGRFRDEKIHEEVDSLVVIFMSHGCEKDIFYTSDEEMVTCDEVIDVFSNTACLALIGKPKVFFFQMCRGTNEHIPVFYTSTDALPSSEPSKRLKARDRKVSDVFICYSSLSGFASYRHLDHGSYFVYYVCKVFMEQARNKSLNSLMKEVNRRASTPVACEIREVGTTRDFFFNPLSNQEQACIKKVARQFTNIEHQSLNRSKRCVKDMRPPANKDTYNQLVSTSCHGTALIINNLQGCRENLKDLTNVFSNHGYRVHGPFSDATRDQIFDQISYCKKVSHESSLFVIFYGYGDKERFVASDGKVVTYQELFRSFNDVNCPSLAGKPKIFIFNTCFHTGTVLEEGEVNVCEATVPQSGTKLPSGWSTDELIAASTVKDGYVPAEQDMLLFSVEMDGKCERGSLLTDALYQVLQPCNGCSEITPLMHLVARRLKELRGGSEAFITEIRRINFRKDFYFAPPKSITPRTPPSENKNN